MRRRFASGEAQIASEKVERLVQLQLLHDSLCHASAEVRQAQTQLVMGRSHCSR
jgi:hypothetical protein